MAQKRSTLFAQLLKQRKVDEAFLNPNYKLLADPDTMPDLDLAVERIFLAADRGEKVVIYGDYDVDGVCASAVMEAALREAGIKEVEILLPNRFGEGYGMNQGAIDEIKNLKASLVVTVDCGSGSGAVIDSLKELGIDVIVTDHHEVLDLPKGAWAVLNPKRRDMVVTDGHGLADMAGVGVAFTLARALNARRNGGVCDGREKWLLDLVAIGTICDSMMLTRDNRVLVYWGLKVLSKTRRPGLRALMRSAGVKNDMISAQAVGFQIGPRLNASGRMETARWALDLLLTKNNAEAAYLAEKLEVLNKKRKQVQDEAVREIDERGVNEDKVLVVEGEWHEGVIGIIAGRLVEKYARPSIVLTDVGAGLMKGSGRSFGDFSLADCLVECQNLLVKGGGHDFACGLTIAKGQVGNFREKVNNFYESLDLKNQARFLEVNGDLQVKDFADLNEEFCDELSLLEPYGEGNKEPVLTAVAKVFSVRIMKDKHLSLTVRDENGRFLRLVGFYVPENWLSVLEGDSLELKFNLLVNEWDGRKSVEGRLLGLKKVLEEENDLW